MTFLDADHVAEGATFSYNYQVFYVVLPDKVTLCKFEEEESEKTVEIHCPEDINEEILNLLYRNTKKSGGGEIEKIDVQHSANRIALITFCSYAGDYSIIPFNFSQAMLTEALCQFVCICVG